MKSDDFTDVMLPKYFHYHGMNKIKAGKGYRDGKPVGVISGKCKECGGNIIAIKMNTSSRGFETTSEKVCEDCGLTVPGSFQVLEHGDTHYKTRPTDTHEAWVEQSKPTNDFDDIHVGFENYCHIKGSPTPNADTVISNNKIATNGSTIRLYTAIKRLDNTNESKKMPMDVWRKYKHFQLVDDYAHELNLLPYQINDSKWILDFYRERITKLPYSIEDIVYHICLYMKVLQLGRKSTGILKEARLQGRYIPQLYKAIRSKLNE